MYRVAILKQTRNQAADPSVRYAHEKSNSAALYSHNVIGGKVALLESKQRFFARMWKKRLRRTIRGSGSTRRDCTLLNGRG